MTCLIGFVEFPNLQILDLTSRLTKAARLTWRAYPAADGVTEEAPLEGAWLGGCKARRAGPLGTIRYSRTTTPPRAFIRVSREVSEYSVTSARTAVLPGRIAREIRSANVTRSPRLI